MAKFIGNNIDEWYRNNDESYKASLYKPLENQEVKYNFIIINIKILYNNY